MEENPYRSPRSNGPSIAVHFKLILYSAFVGVVVYCVVEARAVYEVAAVAGMHNVLRVWLLTPEDTWKYFAIGIALSSGAGGLVGAITSVLLSRRIKMTSESTDD